VLKLINSILKALYPNRCIFCNAILDEGCVVCADCISEIYFTISNTCSRCGAPLTESQSDAQCCKQCCSYTFSFNRNVSLGIFDGKLKTLIHQFKFNKRRCLSEIFADLFYRNYGKYIQEHELLVAVPVTKKRFSERGFNQSELIARKLSAKMEVRGAGVIEYFNTLIKRRGNSIPQSETRTLEERIYGPKDNFLVNSRFIDVVNNRSVLLIDDVLTTGTTASLCAEALKEAGAKLVNLLTIARSLRHTA